MLWNTVLTWEAGCIEEAFEGDPWRGSLEEEGVVAVPGELVA